MPKRRLPGCVLLAVLFVLGAPAEPALAAPPSSPPDILVPAGDEPPPSGYRAVRLPNRLAAIGGLMLLSSYGSNVAFALAGEAVDQLVFSGQAFRSGPLFIPIAGPFIAVGLSDHRSGVDVVLSGLNILGGLTQATGAALGIAGLVAPGPRRFYRSAGAGLRVLPLAGGGARGLVIAGSL